MMEGRDWMSMLVGIILTAFGAIPLLSKWIPALQSVNFVEKVGIEIFAYVVAAMGFYLMINSIIEITNSNSIGTISFVIALAFFAVGLLQVLYKFHVGPDWFAFKFLSHTIYYIMFCVEGLFLMVAAFAMEL